MNKIDMREYQRLHRLAFPEIYAAASKRYAATPKGKAKRKINKIRYNKSEKGKQARKRFLQSSTGKAWTKRNSRRQYLRYPEKALTRCRKRQAILRKALIGDPKKILEIYVKANELRRQGYNVVVDHKIPLSKGGAHAIDNLQIIYTFENAQKGVRLDYIPSVIF